MLLFHSVSHDACNCDNKGKPFFRKDNTHNNYSDKASHEIHHLSRWRIFWIGLESKIKASCTLPKTISWML